MALNGGSFSVSFRNGHDILYLNSQIETFDKDSSTDTKFIIRGWYWEWWWLLTCWQYSIWNENSSRRWSITHVRGIFKPSRNHVAAGNLSSMFNRFLVNCDSRKRRMRSLTLDRDVLHDAISRCTTSEKLYAWGTTLEDLLINLSSIGIKDKELALPIEMQVVSFLNLRKSLSIAFYLKM